MVKYVTLIRTWQSFINHNIIYPFLLLIINFYDYEEKTHDGSGSSRFIVAECLC